VAIDAAKTDRDGKAIHDECYVLETNHENASDGHVNEHKRPWPVVAKELSNEQDPAKVIDLAKELIKAFDEDATLKAIHQKPPDVQERAPKFKSNARHT
jgi:hypothetical protein